MKTKMKTKIITKLKEIYRKIMYRMLYIKPYPIQDYCLYNHMDVSEQNILDSILNYPLGTYRTIEEIWDAISDLQIVSESFNKEHKDITLSSIPTYYTQNKGKDIPDQFSEPIKFIVHYNLDFSQGCCLKYLSRNKAKGLSVIDLEKTKFYADVVINNDYSRYEQYKKGRS